MEPLTGWHGRAKRAHVFADRDRGEGLARLPGAVEDAEADVRPCRRGAGLGGVPGQHVASGADRPLAVEHQLAFGRVLQADGVEEVLDDSAHVQNCRGGACPRLSKADVYQGLEHHRLQAVATAQLLQGDLVDAARVGLARETVGASSAS